MSFITQFLMQIYNVLLECYADLAAIPYNLATEFLHGFTPSSEIPLIPQLLDHFAINAKFYAKDYIAPTAVFAFSIWAICWNERIQKAEQLQQPQPFDPLKVLKQTKQLQQTQEVKEPIV